MSQPGGVVEYVLDEPFDVALSRLRRSLALEGLCIPHEFDAAARVRQELGIALKQHVVLYVDDPMQLLEATVVHPSAGLFIPEPIALSSANAGSRLSVRSIEPFLATGFPPSVRGAVSNLHERILAAVQRIAVRETPAMRAPSPRAIPA